MKESAENKNIKNIWIFNHYATKPDEPATRSYDFGRELAKKGHNVTIFASSFSHYKLKEKYLSPKEKYRREKYNGVNFIWIKTFPYKRSDWRRVLNMVTYFWNGFFAARKIKEKPDVVIGTCVHSLAVLVAYLTAKRAKSRFFFEVTDPWPQTLIDLNLLSKRNPIAWILRRLEIFFNRKAEKVIHFVPLSREYMKKTKLDEKKVVIIPNGLDISRYKSIKPYKGGNSNNFKIMFLGGHSKYASLETVLGAAKLLSDRKIKKAKFIFVGEGTQKRGLIKMAKEMALSNVDFRPMVQKNKVFGVMGEADAFISIIRKTPDWIGTISSNKLNDYLISGRPIIFAVGSENNPVKKAKAGIVVPPENQEALAGAVMKMISLSKKERMKMGRNGREYAKKNLDIKILSKRLENLL